MILRTFSIAYVQCKDKGKGNSQKKVGELSKNSKLPQNSENKPRGLYFSKALFEGLIFGGAYDRRGLNREGNLRFKIS